MKKTIVALLLALCMVLGVFAGCTATEPAAPAAPAAEAPAAEAPAAEAPAAEAPAAEAKGLKVHKTYMGADISQLQQLDNVDTNIATLITRKGSEAQPLQTKRQLADIILDRILTLRA